MDSYIKLIFHFLRKINKNEKSKRGDDCLFGNLCEFMRVHIKYLLKWCFGLLVLYSILNFRYIDINILVSEFFGPNFHFHMYVIVQLPRIPPSVTEKKSQAKTLK